MKMCIFDVQIAGLLHECVREQVCIEPDFTSWFRRTRYI